jgi:hypothetical protein
LDMIGDLDMMGDLDLDLDFINYYFSKLKSIYLIFYLSRKATLS